MAQQYYSMDQIAKLAKVSSQQIYYLVNMKFKFKPALVDPSGTKFYDERALGQIFQDLGKQVPKSVQNASPATHDGLLDINAIAETTGLGKKKLRTFIREHKEIKPDFIDEKNHNKKFWGPAAVQYIQDHFDDDEKAEVKEKPVEAVEKPEAAEEAKAAEEVKAEAATAEKVAETEEQPEVKAAEAKKKEEQAAKKPEEQPEAAEEVKAEEKPAAGPHFVKKMPRPAKAEAPENERITSHPEVELPFAMDQQEGEKPEKPVAEQPASTEPAEPTAEKPEEQAEEKNAGDQRFVVRKRESRYGNRQRGSYKRRNGSDYHDRDHGGRQNGYRDNHRNGRENYAKKREMFAGKLKLVTEKGTFYTDQFKNLEECAEYVVSAKAGDFLKVEKYNWGQFAPAYISTKSIIEFEEA